MENPEPVNAYSVDREVISMVPKEIVADFITRSRYEDLPSDVIRLAKRSLLDVLGNMIAGFSTRASTLARRFASSFTHPQESTIFGNENRVPSAFATFANALMGSDLDADDGHRGAMGHPGAAVIASSLAVGEKYGLSGKRFLEGIIAGYEVGIRIGIITNREHETRFWGSGNWCSFGVTAAASRLMGLGREKCLNALGICEAHSPMASLDWMFSGNYSMVKEAIGWGTFTGVSSAILAEEGMTGIFSLADDNETIMNTLGREYEFKKIYFKKHAGCRYTHPAIDGVLRLKKERIFRHEEIEKINIGTFSFGLSLSSQNPKSIQEAQYSIPFTVGAALAYGQVGPAEMCEEKLRDERILAFARKVHLYLDSDIQKRFPSLTLARVEVTLTDGSRLAADPAPMQGDYQNPFTDEEMDERFQRYARTLIDEEDISDIISLEKRVEEIENIKVLIEMVNFAMRRSIRRA